MTGTHPEIFVRLKAEQRTLHELYLGIPEKTTRHFFVEMPAKAKPDFGRFKIRSSGEFSMSATLIGGYI